MTECKQGLNAEPTNFFTCQTQSSASSNTGEMFGYCMFAQYGTFIEVLITVREIHAMLEWGIIYSLHKNKGQTNLDRTCPTSVLHL